ncbi:hypothetical protein CHCC20331_2764 [Bacillus paralicheniformis]|nr:hypothetical protein CHCC20348_0626 [Bacillus paralicheniformis]TWK87403.1 hypothetical protein CHCC20331_2764 [Bacillus paralicheniformis]
MVSLLRNLVNAFKKYISLLSKKILFSPLTDGRRLDLKALDQALASAI